MSILCGRGLSAFQSTLPSQGATGASWQGSRRKIISIHAPLTGSDHVLLKFRIAADISIHAPLTGSDFLTNEIDVHAGNFNPRSPHRERPITKKGGI